MWGKNVPRIRGSLNIPLSLIAPNKHNIAKSSHSKNMYQHSIDVECHIQSAKNKNKTCKQTNKQKQFDISNTEICTV